MIKRLYLKFVLELERTKVMKKSNNLNLLSKLILFFRVQISGHKKTVINYGFQQLTKYI